MIKLVKGLFYNEEQSKAELCRFIMESDQLSLGSRCAAFEEAFAQYQQRRHAVLFNSGSSANLALIQALINQGQIPLGAKAGFSAITWATNVMPLMQLGLKPVPIDVELDTLNISARSVIKVLDASPDIKLVFVTNLLGFCGDLERIRELCDARGILLIEDNCEALGTVYRGRKLGNWGLASTFSFFVGHHMSTIEGGAVCTDDPDLNRMLRLVRAHGWDRNLTDIEKTMLRREHGVDNSFFDKFTFYTLGYNLRPTEITGFLGLQQLQYLNVIVQKRQENFSRFQAVMADNNDFMPLRTNNLDVISNFAMPVICRSPELANRHIQAFTAADVEVRPIVGGSIPDQPFYKNIVGETDATPNARTINHQGFYFGNNPELTEAEIQTLERLLRDEDGRRTPISQKHADVHAAV